LKILEKAYGGQNGWLNNQFQIFLNIFGIVTTSKLEIVLPYKINIISYKEKYVRHISDFPLKKNIQYEVSTSSVEKQSRKRQTSTHIKNSNHKLIFTSQ